LEEKIEKRWKELRKIGECRPRELDIYPICMTLDG
jgi:hypothetical protein